MRKSVPSPACATAPAQRFQCILLPSAPAGYSKHELNSTAKTGGRAGEQAQQQQLLLQHAAARGWWAAAVLAHCCGQCLLPSPRATQQGAAPTWLSFCCMRCRRWHAALHGTRSHFGSSQVRCKASRYLVRNKAGAGMPSPDALLLPAAASRASSACAAVPCHL